MSTYLGQNFLIDTKVKQYIKDIVAKYKYRYNISNCIEIWPGKWAITKLIYTVFWSNLKVIEKDITMADHISFLNDKQIIWWDILDYQANKWDKDSLVYWSLPYYITSPIIGKFFVENKYKYGIFIVQKERAEKVQTIATKKSYLWWLLNNNYTIELSKTIKPKSFNPPPKIDSAIVKITYHGTNYIDHNTLQLVLDKISWYKRKTIGKILKILWYDLDDIKISDIGIYKKRLEQLDWDDMNTICKIVK